MHKMVHSLTMLLVLYHTLVGCCWHHAHAAALSDRADVQVTASCCGHSHHEHDTGAEPADHSPRDGRGCEHGRCVFLVPPVDGNAGIVDAVARADVIWGDLPPRGRLSSSVSTSELPPPVGLPPHRLHLVNRVLLI